MPSSPKRANTSRNVEASSRWRLQVKDLTEWDPMKAIFDDAVVVKIRSVSIALHATGSDGQPWERAPDTAGFGSGRHRSLGGGHRWKTLMIEWVAIAARSASGRAGFQDETEAATTLPVDASWRTAAPTSATEGPSGAG